MKAYLEGLPGAVDQLLALLQDASNPPDLSQVLPLLARISPQAAAYLASSSSANGTLFLSFGPAFGAYIESLGDLDALSEVQLASIYRQTLAITAYQFVPAEVYTAAYLRAQVAIAGTWGLVATTLVPNAGLTILESRGYLWLMDSFGYSAQVFIEDLTAGPRLIVQVSDALLEPPAGSDVGTSPPPSLPGTPSVPPPSPSPMTPGPDPSSAPPPNAPSVDPKAYLEGLPGAVEELLALFQNSTEAELLQVLLPLARISPQAAVYLATDKENNGTLFLPSAPAFVGYLNSLGDLDQMSQAELTSIYDKTLAITAYHFVPAQVDSAADLSAIVATSGPWGYVVPTLVPDARLTVLERRGSLWVMDPDGDSAQVSIEDLFAIQRVWRPLKWHKLKRLAIQVIDAVLAPPESSRRRLQ